MVERQFRTSLRTEMVTTDLLSCFFFTILYHLMDCKMVSDQFFFFIMKNNARNTVQKGRPMPVLCTRTNRKLYQC